VPISAADVATMMETMGVDRVITLELHSGQIQGFFAPRTAVENLQVSIVGATYFAERDLKNPVVVSPDGGGVPRAKMFREVLTQRGHPNTDMAMLIEQRNYDMGGHIVRAEGPPQKQPIQPVKPLLGPDANALNKANQGNNTHPCPPLLTLLQCHINS
jgi:phosphoribosylpyrophosphate synthetase